MSNKVKVDLGEDGTKKKKKWKKALLFTGVALVIIIGIMIALTGKLGDMETFIHIDEPEQPQQKQLNIWKGNDRPIAVMIDNHKDAWPHYGLQDAYCVYEIIVEGGETRLMALFKGADVEKIGPVRSARHYFVEYAMEHGAIYTHFGNSPKAATYFTQYKTERIDGITDSAGFWRVNEKASPHNALTSTDRLLEVAKQKKYKTQSNVKSLLNYTTEEVNLSSGAVANNVMIKTSQSQNTSYVYDEASKVYLRSMRGMAHKDYVTGKQYTTKNIIVMHVKNYNLNDEEGKGRQELDTVGTGKGYYITNGQYIEITWSKASKTDKTIYKDLSGNEIQVNDGNTFIQICPLDATITIQ